jgi:hypothetical protein
LTLGALALVHEHPFDVLLSARNLSQHLPEQSKLSRPIIFGARGADHQSRETNIVHDEAIPKEAASQKRGASEKNIMTNPYAKKPKASLKKTIMENPYVKKPKASLKKTTANPYAKKPKASPADGPVEMVRDSAAVIGTDEIDTDDKSEASMEDLLAETIEASEDGNPGFDYENLQLNEENLVWISVCLATDVPLQDIAESIYCDKLDNPLDSIHDKLWATQGDGYHGMARPKVPVLHSLKKPFYIALMEAWYSWEQETFGKIMVKLKLDGMTDKDIEGAYIFNTQTFLGCCPRTVPPPSTLYWRIRAVFTFFGHEYHICSFCKAA